MSLEQTTAPRALRTAIGPERLAGRRPYWLAEVTTHEADANPRTWRYGVDAVQVTTASGAVLDYLEGLGELEVTLGDGLPAMTISILANPDGVPWSKLVARGLDLQACTCTVLRWYEGTTYEEALCVARGRVVAPSYGDEATPLQFSVAADLDSGETVPPESALISPTTWPVTTSPATAYGPEQGNGSYYPWVFGQPGLNGGPFLNVINARMDVHATPAPVIEQGGASALAQTVAKICIAGHVVRASTVFVRDLSAGYMTRPYSRMQEQVQVRTMQDRLGRTVSYVLASDCTRVRISDGSSYAVSWNNGGGLPNDTGSGLMRGAGQVIEYLLGACQVPVNRGRMRAARARLDRFGLDFALTTPTKARDFIEREIGSLLPLILRWSSAGVWYELMPYDATERDVVARLVADDSDTGDGLRVTRAGDVTWTSVQEIANDITIRYGREYNDALHKQRRISWRQPDDVIAGEAPSAHCALSRSRYGARPVTIETDIVYEDATASAILSLWAMWRALPRRQMRYVGGAELDHIEPGAVVTVTDSELYLTRALAWVRSVSMSLSSTSLELELLEQPQVRSLERS